MCFCYTCDTFWSGGAIPDAFRLLPAEIDHPLLLIADPQWAGILRGTGLDQSFLCHSFQKTFGRAGEVFTLILTELPNQFVSHLVVQEQKFLIMISNAGSEAKFTRIISVEEMCLVAFQ